MSKFHIPLAALDQHIAILGKTGSGKTWAAKTIVEHILRQRRQTCVIDPTGAWYGLRLAADGKGRGLDVVLLGGEHADIPLAERSGAAVARLVTEQGVNVVIDTSGFTVGEYTRWFIDFAGTLYTTLRNPLNLVIDEAHYFAPQGRVPDVDAAKMLHATNRLMSGGRSRGVRGMLITQRPAKLHKDSLTCADTLIAMRVIAPQDRQAIKDWIDGCGDVVGGKAVLDSLAQLKRGEGWVWYPEGGHLERITFPAISTYDSSAAPKHGAKAAPKLTQIDLSEVNRALAEAVKEAEANDPKLLRKRIAELELERKLAERPADVREVVKFERVEVPVLANGQLDGCNELVRTLQATTTAMLAGVDDLRMAVAKASAPKPSIPVVRQPVVAVPRTAATATKSAPSDATVGTGGLRRILIALAQRPGLTNRQIGLRAGLSSKSGTFATCIGRARSSGWIRDEGDRRFITEGGVNALGDYMPLPTGRELLSHWLNELGSGGISRILQSLADVYPEGLTNEQLGTAAGISHTSGTFATHIGRLRGLELIEGRGVVRAAAEFFE